METSYQEKLKTNRFVLNDKNVIESDVIDIFLIRLQNYFLIQ